MPGWIKLWRQTIDHGHFSMPDLCFKLWVYCLLKARPFPADELAPGELYLSYKEIQDNLGQRGKTISKSTISAALRFLHQQGYLEVNAVRFMGMKIKVLNWQRYQGSDEQGQELARPAVGIIAGEDCNSKNNVCGPGTPPAPEKNRPGISAAPSGPFHDTTAVLAVYPIGTPTVQVNPMPGTPAVPVQEPPGIHTIPAWYAESTSTGTVAVPEIARETSDGAGYGMPKNKSKNTKESGSKVTPQPPFNQKRGGQITADNIQLQFPRYNSKQTDLILDYWHTISETRKTRTISPSIVAKQMTYWERYPVWVVMEALSIHLKKYRDKREEYTSGIMRRLAREQANWGNTTEGGDACGSSGQDHEPPQVKRTTSRYAHLVQ